MKGVGLNASRSALLDVLRAMGADIRIDDEREHGGEPLADLIVRTAPLHGVTVDGALIPNLIDEIPVLAVAAACAEGRTEIRDAAELRVKETDRLAAMATNLQALGADVEEFEDGLAITGGAPLTGTTVNSFDDHRIAMAMGVAGLMAEGTTTITDADCARVSFPGFWTTLDEVAF
jgi:3-phosphoshikimate 1-carboxyvinyltransferase